MYVGRLEVDVVMTSMFMRVNARCATRCAHRSTVIRPTREDQLCTLEQVAFCLPVMIGCEASAMKIKIGVALAMVLVTFARINAKTFTLNGWVSDESCGTAHTKTGNESCVAKCLRGGASVGHPEWLPQRMVLVSDDGKTTWIVENPATLITQAGHHVVVDVTLSTHANSVRILRLHSK